MDIILHFINTICQYILQRVFISNTFFFLRHNNIYIYNCINFHQIKLNSILLLLLLFQTQTNIFCSKEQNYNVKIQN